ncbi:MFS transporter [Spirillospora sp. NPDC029432]|uniref:MFS transporter n=1 Tax=Spirillospora sp. NPDC029432 TaxID=3154599 RepID=UPI0034514A7A
MSRAPWERDFRLLWRGSVVAQFGAVGAGTASPLLALSLNGSPVSAGWVSAAAALPGLLFHLPAGWLADRADRRSIMWVSQIVRCVSAGMFVAGFWLLGGPPWLLVAGVTVAGTCAVFFGIAESAAVRDIVYGINQETPKNPQSAQAGTAGRESDLRQSEEAERSAVRKAAMARHEARHHIAQFVGRPLGGLLFGAQHLLPYLVDALTALYSLRMMSRMRTGEFEPAYRNGARRARRGRPRRARGRIRDGLAHLFRDRFLCAVIVICAIANFFFQMVVLLLVVTAEERGISSSLTGLFLAASGVGGLVGALVAPRMLRRYGPPVIVVGCVWSWLLLVGVVAVADHPMIGLVAWGCCSIMGAHVNVALEVHKGATVPRDLQGQISGVTGFVTGGAIPLGALSAGYVIEELNPETTAVLVTCVMGALAAVSSLPLLPRLFRRRAAAAASVPAVRADGDHADAGNVSRDTGPALAPWPNPVGRQGHGQAPVAGAAAGSGHSPVGARAVP